jgi:hypothetical protein
MEGEEPGNSQPITDEWGGAWVVLGSGEGGFSCL